MLKDKGLQFLDTWFGTPKGIPPDLTRLYQLLLHMVTMKGTIPVILALRLGYTRQLIQEAVKRKYVELSLGAKKPSEDVSKRIREIIGKPSRKMVV